MTTKSTGRTQQVTMSLDLYGLRKYLLQQMGHHLFFFRTHTTTIKTDIRHL